jgi:serine/threonine-protein kinase HipA
MPSRIRRVTTAVVKLWELDVGAVSWNDDRGVAVFEYAPEFLRHNLSIAPIQMPLRPGVFSFPSLNNSTFHGLSGLLADALPDRFGNRIIDLWLARQGR